MSLELTVPYRSYSSLTTFTSCGKQWQLSRLFKVPETPAWYLAGGSAVHKATERNDLNGARVLSQLEATDLFMQAWHEEVNEQVEKSGVPMHEWRAGGRRSKAYPDKENAAWWIDHGPGMVEKYSLWLQSLFDIGWQLVELGGRPAVEVELLANFGDVPVKMGIDRLLVSPHGEQVVVDLKTGSRDPDSNLQLGFYASGLELVLGMRPSYGSYYMARTQKLTDIAPLDVYTVPMITAELQMLNVAIENRVFLPRRGSHCVSCGVRDACAAVGGSQAHLYDPQHPDYGKATA